MFTRTHRTFFVGRSFPLLSTVPPLVRDWPDGLRC